MSFLSQCWHLSIVFSHSVWDFSGCWYEKWFLIEIVFIYLFCCGFPRWHSGKESTCQCSRGGFSLWGGKVPWRKKRQPTPVFLPGPSRGQRGDWWATVDGVTKSGTQLSEHTHINFFVPLCQETEKATAPHSSTLAWKIPWMEEPGGLQSLGSLRVGHDWVTSLSLFTFLHWRRTWQPIPVLLPGESQGRQSLVGCRLWSLTESDTTEAT